MSVTTELDAIQNAMESITRKRWVTTVGLNPSALPTRITPQEHIQLALHIGTLDDVSAWARGDQVVIIREEVKRLGYKSGWQHKQTMEYLQERYQELLKLYRNVELKTLLNNASTSSWWKYEDRRQSQHISYAHHAELNGYPQEMRDDMLDKVEAGGWTVSRLRYELSGQRNVVADRSPLSIERITELFRSIELPVQIEARRAVFLTEVGRIVVESASDLIWRTEQ